MYRSAKAAYLLEVAFKKIYRPKGEITDVPRWEKVGKGRMVRLRIGRLHSRQRIHSVYQAKELVLVCYGDDLIDKKTAELLMVQYGELYPEESGAVLPAVLRVLRRITDFEVKEIVVTEVVGGKLVPA